MIKTAGMHVLLLGSLLVAALPVYAGHPITKEELQKACGSLLTAARNERIDYYEGYIRMFPSGKESREARTGLSHAYDNNASDADWFINWAQAGPGFAGMQDRMDDPWLNEGRNPEQFRKVANRLSGSSNAKGGVPMALAGICAMRAHVAALEGADLAQIIRVSDQAGVKALAENFQYTKQYYGPRKQRPVAQSVAKPSDGGCAKVVFVNGKKICDE
jgi:hypothetical protein